MKKFIYTIGGALLGLSVHVNCLAQDMFELLPELPEALAGGAAQASSVSTTDNTVAISTQTVGPEPNLLSMFFSLLFVIALIYATGIVYTKLNKFGLNALKKKTDSSQISVISTTPLGSNKTLHIVELDGKRLLIGASSSSIHLIKDLGNYPPEQEDSCEFSKIEIPNIRIPKIEIPKIEIPALAKFLTNHDKTENDEIDKKLEQMSNINITTKEEPISENEDDVDEEDFEIPGIYSLNSSDGIIDNLFKTKTSKTISKPEENVHKVNPDEFALYRKYL